ncbi:nicotinate (nicotinamide) nucleotide adenylyltransferase [Cetobacterium somerae]|uniref:nicotinate (nicotinamide) nucleotide adenylyltransferase n=1 Tax=Cetobacterium sp. NK01 TaxID=2993530 RepID=UPI00211614EB|nr:nicotinate (nicotinamide) nucleotide adenylyltransferase [Cetobacterium sp. NK01]MCQ8211264.1 nicotinate (nicotinamide) nucleotide adenylyltransferase [Cetobacterium sp. NK01]
MKIGIYGGSFNPIHNGHIYMAKFIIDYLKLDKLLIIPVGIPSHREKLMVSGELRLEMCKLAFKLDPKIEVLDLEVKSNKLSFTYDTLLKIIKKYPNNEYFEIIGEDSGAYFHKWKKYQEILKLSKVVVLQREGYTTLLKDPNLLQVKNPFLNYSSTRVRESIMNGVSIDNMVPKVIAEFIKSHNLYQK